MANAATILEVVKVLIFLVMLSNINQSETTSKNNIRSGDNSRNFVEQLHLRVQSFSRNALRIPAIVQTVTIALSYMY